ncbi:peptide-binding protein [Cohnella rhizosphaerae]|uniref:Peptide-binding protein n=1 Tax=Cohnella rhizosphaerae TaxID=1457232 RepID=A0A9X4KVY1_9BACL|nr:peptide-binding protein [Cohnella rhizosphaerae]MDG0811433.1 peptide-binding protein [Cohnella rhizosphaerae]
MKKGMTALLTSIIGLSLVLAGCSSNDSKGSASPSASAGSSASASASAPARSGGTVTVAQASEPGNLNPLIYATTTDTNVTHMIFDPLVKPDAELKMTGGLAKSWDISEDGLTYTFHLNEGVKWHDGQPFTAKDVAFTFTSMADPRYDGGAYSRVQPVVGAADFHDGKADSVSGIKVVDDNTISFTLATPNASFIASLFIGILPEHLLKDVSPSDWAKNAFNRNPVGTGPFKFVKWETGQYIEVAANPDYFGGAPKLDKVITRFGDANTMLAAFMNQEVDIVPVAGDQVPSIETLDFADVKAANDLSVYYVGFNLLNPFFKDLKVRQALSYGTDKNLIVSSIIGEYGEVSDDLFPNAHWSHNPDVTKYPYDKAKAKQLLEEAGFKLNGKGIYEKDGKELKFSLSVPTGKTEREKTGVLLKQQWGEIGVGVEIVSLDFSTLVTKLLPTGSDGKQRAVKADDYDAYILGFGVEADPDEYRSYFDSKFMPPNGYNFVSYSNPKIDGLFDQELTQTNQDERTSTFHEIAKILSDDVPWIPIYGQKSVFASNKKIEGFDPDFRGVSFNAKDWSLK